MGEAIQCNLCGSPATVHLTQIINNKIQKVDLCEHCAQEKGVTDPEGFSLAELVAKNFTSDEESSGQGEALRCEHCGTTPATFKKHGRLGCPACYEALAPLLDPMLKNMHRDSRHTGKIPQRMLKRTGIRQRLNDLEEKLQTSVQEERYEDAARYRDEIDQLRETLSAGEPGPSG